MTLDEAKAALATFIERNPSAKIDQDEDSAEKTLVKFLWNEDSLYLVIPDEKYEDLFEALNVLLFPERFTAVWHSDSKDFEIIYTAFPLYGSQSVMRHRRFDFIFKETSYRCEFGASSSRLMAIAAAAVFAGPSNTEHRNLQSFSMVHDFHENGYDEIKLDPISFWIRNVEWNEETAVELVRHLNFYMSYYDAQSPKIELHPPKQETRYAARERYITGSFPTEIRSMPRNSNLLHFWVASRGGDIFRRFLYCYQILEFSSFYFIEDNVKRAVKRTLSTPHFKDQIDSLMLKIIDHVQESKIWDGNKIEALLKEVSCELVWREVEKNKEYFCTPTTFDGGFVMKPLITDKATLETFRHDWHTKVAHASRGIRNALSHGREPQSGSAVIAPTHENLTLLQPWAGLLSVVAGEVVVYQDSII